MVQCPYFVVQLYEIEKSCPGNTLRSFDSLLILDGEGVLYAGNKSMKLCAGDSIFLPKGIESYRIDGKMQLLISAAEENREEQCT